VSDDVNCRSRSAAKGRNKMLALPRYDCRVRSRDVLLRDRSDAESVPKPCYAERSGRRSGGPTLPTGYTRRGRKLASVQCTKTSLDIAGQAAAMVKDPELVAVLHTLATRRRCLSILSGKLDLATKARGPAPYRPVYVICGVEAGLHSRIQTSRRGSADLQPPPTEPPGGL
jgi:hypothetical protein